MDEPVPGDMLAHMSGQRKVIFRALFCYLRPATVPGTARLPGRQRLCVFDFKPERTMNDYLAKVQS
jgi:hypothetical protein